MPTLNLVSAAVLVAGGGALVAPGLREHKPAPRGRERMPAVGANLLAHRGSVFAPGIGADPLRSVCAVVNRLAQALAMRHGGRQVTLA